MYQIVYEWHLPEKENSTELLHDFETIKKLAAEHGALTSHMFQSPEHNKFIGIQIWTSKEDYDKWFDQQTFAFREKQTDKEVQLLKKIKDVYKNRFIGDIIQVSR